MILIPVRDPLDHAPACLTSTGGSLAATLSRAPIWAGSAITNSATPTGHSRGMAQLSPAIRRKLDYWLAQWIAAHQRIDALERQHENIQLVPYDALTSDARIWPAIARRIGIAAAPLKEIRFSPISPLASHLTPLIRKAGMRRPRSIDVSMTVPADPSAQYLAYHPLVDARERFDVLDRSAFADLVHGRIRTTKIDDGAEQDEESAV